MNEDKSKKVQHCQIHSYTWEQALIPFSISILASLSVAIYPSIFLYENPNNLCAIFFQIEASAVFINFLLIFVMGFYKWDNISPRIIVAMSSVHSIIYFSLCVITLIKYTNSEIEGYSSKIWYMTDRIVIVTASFIGLLCTSLMIFQIIYLYPKMKQEQTEMESLTHIESETDTTENLNDNENGKDKKEESLNDIEEEMNERKIEILKDIGNEEKSKDTSKETVLKIENLNID